VLSDDNGNHSLPPHCWDEQIDPELPPLTIAGRTYRAAARPKVCLSNSFAFGGNNASLIIGRLA
jgi:3-oxoacyl-[acyl-carrier-protein] synthase-1